MMGLKAQARDDMIRLYGRFSPHPQYSRYEGSTLGVVRRVGHINPLKIFVMNSGYRCVSLYDGDAQRTAVVARFVFECFHGKVPKSRMVVRLNGLKLDDRVENLASATPSQARKLAHKLSRVSGMARSDEDPNAVFEMPSEIEQAGMAALHVGRGISYKDLARMKGIPAWLVKECVDRYRGVPGNYPSSSEQLVRAFA